MATNKFIEINFEFQTQFLNFISTFAGSKEVYKAALESKDYDEFKKQVQNEAESFFTWEKPDRNKRKNVEHAPHELVFS